MKSIMITGPSSNTGKTTITLGLIRALKNRGLDISAFKTGPDFIDLKYLEQASGKRAGNLDLHLMGRDGIKYALAMNQGEYAIVEGAMGYFDGIYNTFENSSFDIGKKLNIPAILIYRPQGEMFSAIPKIKGMVGFPGANIQGIILNKVSQGMYGLLKEQVEKYIGIEVLGYLPEDKTLAIESRYLGLVQAEENEASEKFISHIARKVEETIEVDKVLKIAKSVSVVPYEYPGKKDITVGIAYDEAFSFYYNENLSLLESTCHIEYFSPIRDKKLPKVDWLYIGGGYPELYKKELSSNRDMTASIREYAKQGGPIIAEAGGLMYLTDSIEGYEMNHLIKGHTSMTDRLQRFGYVNIQLNQDTLLGQKGDKLTGHEYHRSTVHTKELPVFNITKPMNVKRNWQCGYTYKNVLAYYQHIHFLGNMNAFNRLLSQVEIIRNEGHNVY